MKKQSMGVALSIMAFTAVLAAVEAAAAIEPACLFNDNMVLQRGKAVPVWGRATAGNEIRVSFAGERVKTVVGADGCWRVDLPEMEASSEGRTLEIVESEPGWFGSTVDTKEVTNVGVGEVWLCGGQSNMTFAMWPSPSIGQHAGRERNGYYDLLLTDEPDVRGVHMPCCWAPKEVDHARLGWFDFTPANDRGNFSAAAWHFAVRLHQALKVPVGVIECAWGGSCIETWIPPFAYAESKSFKALATRPVRTEWTEAEKKNPKNKGKKPDFHQDPRACWNAMVHPLAPYAIKGAIWYQGCSNRGRWAEYYEMLETLRAGWGRAFECGADMPFFLCQIAPYGYGCADNEEKDTGATQIREEMERFGRSNGNNVGCAILSDVGELDNIHPGDKRTVGTRLAALALNRIYGRKDLKCDAPVFVAAKLSADGKKVTLTFDNVESWNRNGTYAPRFELAGGDGKYVAVKAEYTTRSKTIDLVVPAGLVPEKVAYMRRSCVHGFIKNEAGLPLGPFRGTVSR